MNSGYMKDLLKDWKERAEKAEAELSKAAALINTARDEAAISSVTCGQMRKELECVQAQLSHMTSVNESLTNKLQSVLAREAEMRPLVGMLECKCDSASNGGYTCPRCHALSYSAGTGYVRKEDVVPLVEAIESAVKNCFFCRGTGAITKAADRMSAEPPPLPHECQDCKPLREALAHAKAKGLLT